MIGRDVLIYLLARLYRKYGRPIAGRKKIQKLLFLVEHLRGKRLSRSSGVTGYRFVIWSYGPFSKEIYDDLDYLVDNSYVEEEVRGSDSFLEYEGIKLIMYNDDGFNKAIFIYKPTKKGFELAREAEERLGGERISQIESIIESYGYLSPQELESHVIKMLGLTPEKKIKYWGIDIDAYLEREGIVETKIQDGQA